MLTVRVGENALFNRTLYDNTGANLAASSLTSGQADIIQNGTILTTYTYPSAQLHLGTSSNIIVLDIPIALSSTFQTLYPVEVRWTFKVTNANFAEGVQEDVITETILQVV